MHRKHWLVWLCDVLVAAGAQAQIVPSSVTPGAVERQFHNLPSAVPLLPAERRSDTAQSAGVGLRRRFNDHLSGWIEFAQPFSRDVALEGNRHGRVFLAITGGF